MKDVKRQASELPVVPSDRAGVPATDPNVIPPEDMTLLGELGLAVGNRLKRGRYGVVYEGRFTETFSLEKLTTDKLHYLYIRPEQKSDTAEEMRPGRKFAVKFCDIESRKAYHIEDIEQRLQQEINFVRRVAYNPETAVVRVYCILATKPTRYYMLMELADDNLQCLINTYVAQNRQLPPQHVLAVYETLLGTVRSLHQQKLTYGMMRTSNILIFGQTAPPAEGQPAPVEAPFRVKIADFVRSLDLSVPGLAANVVEDAVEEDLDDLYYVHSELFTLTRFDFAKYQAFKESLKVMTDINAHRNSMATLDKVLELVTKFAREL